MNKSQDVNLVRKVNLPLLTFYGIGTILGAGIYVLIGKVAGYAGMQTPIAFLVAAILAGLTAFSYAELSVRFPKSAGEAIYIEEAFKQRLLSILVGVFIVSVGITSTATLLNGLTGYINQFIEFQPWLIVVFAVLGMTIVVVWGIGESVLIASIMTVVEIIGLLIIIWVAKDSFQVMPDQLPKILAINDAMIWSGVMLGAFVAFYAFIGFEDMVNIAEEVKNPAKTLPWAIIIALAVTTFFYIIIALVSVLSVAPAELAKSDAPLALIYRVKTGSDPYFISFISIISIFNGALVQLVMASRVLYGMSKRRWIPVIFSRVNQTTHTPIHATVFVSLVILAMALFFPILSLAKLTSFITLFIFILINLALWRIKHRSTQRAEFNVPLWVPIVGSLSCAAFLTYQIIS